LNIINTGLAALIFSAVYCLYEPVIGGLLGMNEFLAARPIIIILFLFMSVYFIFIPYEEIVLVSGNPLQHTIIYVCVISTNILLNVILIPHWGLAGAAISTGLALMVMLVTVLVYSRKKLGINVLTGSVGIY
jgi:O-antigen/teichoic acid export membrane protein